MRHRPDPIGFGLAPAPRTGDSMQTCQCVGPSPAEAARTPSHALTGTLRSCDRRPGPPGVSIPLRRRRPRTVTPRGDRSRHFDETAYGTERFLGRGLRHGRRPLTRQGRAGLTPYGCLAPPGLHAAAREGAPGGRPQAEPSRRKPKTVKVDRVCRIHRHDVRKTSPWKERRSTFRGHMAVRPLSHCLPTRNSRFSDVAIPSVGLRRNRIAFRQRR
jgi:hypothetical protein